MKIVTTRCMLTLVSCCLLLTRLTVGATDGSHAELHNSDGAVVSVTEVNVDGTYTFADIAPGQYSVIVTNTGSLGTMASKVVVNGAPVSPPKLAPPLSPPSPDSPLHVAILNDLLPGGDLVFTMISTNAGCQVTAWADWNGDGILSDPSERVLSNTVVSRYPHIRRIAIPVTAAPGPSTLKFAVTWTNPPAGSATLEYPITVLPAAVIGSQVWNDLNGNGVRDAGELGMAHVLVNLFRTSDSVCVGSTFTDTNGVYTFSVPTNTYYLVFRNPAPAGYIFSPRGQGGDPAFDSDPDSATGRTTDFAVAAGANPGHDAGLIPLAHTRSYFFNKPYSVTDWTITNSLPQFDPSLGRLTAVYVSASEGFGQSMGFENTGNGQASCNAHSLATITAAVLGVTTSMTLTNDMICTNGTFDGIADFAGTSGSVQLDRRLTVSQSIAETNALAGFVGTGTLPFSMDVDTWCQVQIGGGNANFEIATVAGATFGVTYVYDPNRTCHPLGLATNFNALIFGDLTAAGGDTEGRLAVGGTARFTVGYSVGFATVGESIAPDTGNFDRLIVGADLYDGWWDVNGNTVYGGTRYGPVKYTGSNTIRRVSPVTLNAAGNVPNDGSGVTFPALLAQFRASSSALGALADLGVLEKTAHPAVGTFNLVGTNDHLNVFNVQVQDWSCSRRDIVLVAPAGSTVLVNIHGASVSLSNGAMRVTGVSANDILFNYVDATRLDTASFNHEGSVLAPYANAHLHSSAITGSAVFGGNVVTETGFEFHNFPFRGRICIDGSTPSAGAGAGGSGVVEYEDEPGSSGGSSGASWQRADFAVTAIALVNPPTLAGEVFGVQVTVSNHGEIAGDAGRLEVYVSQPVSVAAGTAGDASVMVGVLQPGQSRTFEFADLYSDTRSGTHHCRAFVNSEETTAEWSYGDNQMSKTYQVSAIILSISPTSTNVLVSWNSFWGQKYSLYRRASPGGPSTLVQEHIEAAPPTNIVHDALQPVMAFYHLSVEP